jgi:four helix bundle protein
MSSSNIQISNTPPSERKPFDLEQRTEKFAGEVRSFIRSLPRTISNIEDIKQLVRCSGSVAANYIEANDALGRKDFLMKIKLSRREAKESRLFLKLLWTNNDSKIDADRDRLIQETGELVNILSRILQNSIASKRV